MDDELDKPTTSDKQEIMKNIEVPSIFKNGKPYSASCSPSISLSSRKRPSESRPEDEPAERLRRFYSPEKGNNDFDVIGNDDLISFDVTKEQSIAQELIDAEAEANNSIETSFNCCESDFDNDKVTIKEASEWYSKKESEVNNLKMNGLDEVIDLEELGESQHDGKEAIIKPFDHLSESEVSEAKEMGMDAIMLAIQGAVFKAIEPMVRKMSDQNTLINKLDVKIDALTNQMAGVLKLTNKSCACANVAPNLAQILSNQQTPSKWGLSGQGRVQQSLAPTLVVSTASLDDTDIHNPNSYSKVTQSRSTAGASSNILNANVVPPILKPVPMNPAYKLARKCQGFHPLSSRDIGRVGAHYSHIKDDEARFQEAGKECIREFLFNELKMSKRVISDLRIISVFFPPVGASKATLFAEFHNEEEVQLIKSYAKNLAPTEKYPSMLVHYIPRSLQQRFAAVESKAYKIRHDSKKTLMTRIWIGSDFELRTKKKGDSTNWAAITPLVLHDLPPQAPKPSRRQSDIIDTRTPNTPFPLNNDEVFFNVSTYNHFGSLEVDVEN